MGQVQLQQFNINTQLTNWSGGKLNSYFTSESVEGAHNGRKEGSRKGRPIPYHSSFHSHLLIFPLSLSLFSLHRFAITFERLKNILHIHREMFHGQQQIKSKRNEWKGMEWNGVSQPVGQSVSQSFCPLTHARTPLKVFRACSRGCCSIFWLIDCQIKCHLKSIKSTVNSTAFCGAIWSSVVATIRIASETDTETVALWLS